MDKSEFELAKKRVAEIERNRTDIGSLGEKSLHLILKYYFEKDENLHEIKIGKFFADIKNDEGIIEIQTRSFNKLRNKLSVFTKDNKVTLVYPIPHEKRLIWIDDEGNASVPRKSPKTGTFCDAFRELYKIKPFLNNKNLTIKLLLINMDEYRLLNGWSKDRKKGSTRYDRIPAELYDELTLKSREDYINTIPKGLKEIFTVKDFAKTAKISQGSAGIALNVLRFTGAVETVGKEKNAYLYKCN